MKITALIPDELISEVKKYGKGKNTTESLIIALSDWVEQKKIRELNLQVKKNPLQLNHTAEEIRTKSRKR